MIGVFGKICRTHFDVFFNGSEDSEDRCVGEGPSNPSLSLCFKRFAW